MFFPPGLQKEEEEGLAALKCLPYFLVMKNKKKDKKGEDNYTIPYLFRKVPVRWLFRYIMASLFQSQLS